jgi:molybdopterin molybdotransferase
MADKMFDHILTLCSGDDGGTDGLTVTSIRSGAEDANNFGSLGAACAFIGSEIGKTNTDGGRVLLGLSNSVWAVLNDRLIAGRLLGVDVETVSFWPDDDAKGPIVIAPISTEVLSSEINANLSAHTQSSASEIASRLIARALFVLSETQGLAPLFDAGGQFLGEGHEIALRSALPSAVQPPRLRNDCFAMPQGVDWIPLDDALDQLRRALAPVVPKQSCRTHDALGRILAEDCTANRSNPPRANSAVDGYGFAHKATGTGVQRLPLVDGRAAAGQPFDGNVPEGAAVRILTGAILPEGVDTVVLEEDVAFDNAAIVFDGPIKPNANTRKEGEDVVKGTAALLAGHQLRAPDLALLSALNIAEVSVFKPLRVGVLSTGDEIISAPGQDVLPHQIFDANRPMLLSLARSWGFEPVDLGHVKDDPELIKSALNEGGKQSDVIFTSGGASAGDEDHVSRLLKDSGTLYSWRIAIKPGRPLAMAMWQGTPILGLPGNPVAALVCALIAGRPALSALAGAGWREPEAYVVPAAFSKRKKAGRREFLRARLLDDGTVDVFRSEGSGLISGLSWATGLVELPDEAIEVTPGTPVRYLPYSGYGL